MNSFNDFLNSDTENFKQICDYYLAFLGEFSNKSFPFDEQMKLKGAAGKFLNVAGAIKYISGDDTKNYLQKISDFENILREYRYWEGRSGLLKLISPNRGKFKLLTLQDSFHEIYSSTLLIITNVTENLRYSDNLKINGFYNPNNSNKILIKTLINEAISLIEGDISLTEKTKDNIVKYLQKSLKELEREYVDWTRVLGRINETIIVLGALGSLIGGVVALTDAKGKLEQSTVVIQQTSINVSYNVLIDTYNVQSLQHIGSLNNLLALPEKLDQTTTE